MNLLEAFSLIRTQVVAVHADRLGDPSDQSPLHAKVDLNLAPKALANSQDKPGYQVQAHLKVDGYCGPEGDSQRIDVFVAEIKWVADYQQVQGESISFEQFSEHHPILARQLYPLMHAHLMTLLGQLGVGYVQLPIDLTHPQVSAISATGLPSGHRLH